MQRTENKFEAVATPNSDMALAAFHWEGVATCGGDVFHHVTKDYEFLDCNAA